MALIGKVTGSRIAKNKDGAGNVRLLQVEITTPEDIQTVELISGGGEEYNPPNDSLVLITQVSDAWKLGIGINDGIAPSMDEGERKIYSIAAAAISAYINLLNDGIIEINGNSDFAVRYNALKTAFDQLKSDYNAHKHPTAATGPPSIPDTISTADMSPSKVDEVKLP